MVSYSSFNTIDDVNYIDGTWYVTCGELWKSKNDGTSWTAITTGASLTELKCVGTIDNNFMFVGGDNGIVFSTNSGSTWADSFIKSGINIIQIEMLTNNIIWALSADGTLYATTNGGSNWVADRTKSANWLQSICVDNMINVWVAGKNGAILKAMPTLDMPTGTTQFIALKKGWNMISTYVEPADLAIDVVFGGLTNLFLMKNGAGNIYFPSVGIDGIKTFNYLNGYLVYMSDAETFEITGVHAKVINDSMVLEKGWNMISYTNDKSMPIATAFAAISSKVFLVKNGAGAIYLPSAGINGIGNLNPGEGYLIYMTEKVDAFSFPSAE
jgi:hypothetical protein